MTREEAKEMIKHILKVTPKEPPTECDNIEEWLHEDGEIRKALGMAIKALEQEPCGDIVSRRAVVELIEGWWLGHTKEDDLATEVKALPAVTPTAKWIPVSERTPEEHVCDDGFVEPSVSVLVQLNNKDMKVSRYWGSRERYKDRPWIDLSYPTTLEVVAWMPLPEPYGEREG